MAWTQADVDALKSAMARGLRSITTPSSGSMEFQSIDDMRKLLNDMERDVNPTGNPSRRVARFDRGFGE